jgi:hypothetical protein
MWHSLFGCWGGIHQNSPLHREYETVDAVLMDGCPWGVRRRIVAVGDVQRYYNDYYQSVLPRNGGCAGWLTSDLAGFYQTRESTELR